MYQVVEFPFRDFNLQCSLCLCVGLSTFATLNTDCSPTLGVEFFAAMLMSAQERCQCRSLAASAGRATNLERASKRVHWLNFDVSCASNYLGPKGFKATALWALFSSVRGPSTQCLSTLVPTTIKGMDFFETRDLRYLVLGPSGYVLGRCFTFGVQVCYGLP